MNWVDYSIIAIIVLSALVGLARGLVREVVSLGVWVLALVVAWVFHADAADLLTAQLSQPELRVAVAFVGLVLLTLLFGALFGALLTALVDKAGLTGTDRLLGLFFGGARGAVIVAMAVFLVALTPLPSEQWWGESGLIDDFQGMAGWMLSMVPPELQVRLKEI
ncbi:CvpA family protein [Thiorhodococcus mannitoliphagus]|uniref:CvpA family protein n=1 Tax=Thiorhodococcus mannitoliphagus TaxID=329406 RepID=A0A6P1DV19_9GAMM|nr:CvpA family protein [Thiorhodococcus mannitoliphagus]NEX20536.1 CvpA family protein [Thiorhodococcus mannitoliphagus]